MKTMIYVRSMSHFRTRVAGIYVMLECSARMCHVSQGSSTRALHSSQSRELPALIDGHSNCCVARTGARWRGEV